MTEFVDFLKGFNIQTIVSMTGIFALFFWNMKSEMRILEAKIDQQSSRSDRLYEMFIDLLKDK